MPISRRYALAKPPAAGERATMLDPRDPNHPTDQELSRRFVELRVAAGLDVETLARRAGLELDILLALEAGTRGWVLSEIIAVTIGLGEELPNVFAPWNTPAPS